MLSSIPQTMRFSHICISICLYGLIGLETSFAQTSNSDVYRNLHLMADAQITHQINDGSYTSFSHSKPTRPLALKSNPKVISQDSIMQAKANTLARDRWIAKDKALHYGGSLLAVLTLKTLADNSLEFDRDAAIYVGTGITLSLGIGKEIRDNEQPNNIFSYKDLAANVAGALTGLLILLAI